MLEVSNDLYRQVDRIHKRHEGSHFHMLDLYGVDVYTNQMISNETLWNRTRSSHRNEFSPTENLGHFLPYSKCQVDKFLLDFHSLNERREKEVVYPTKVVVGVFRAK